MSPVIQRLRAFLPELPLPCIDSSRCWDFDVALSTLEPDFYNKVVPLHLVLHLEYSILCSELHEDLFSTVRVNPSYLIARLEAALLYCELLEYLYQHYLVVPREVGVLHAQRVLLRQLLVEYTKDDKIKYTFATELVNPNDPLIFSSSLYLRNQTTWFNWGRILLNRSNRVINLFADLIYSAPVLQQSIRSIETYVIPCLTYVNLVFHVPRLAINSYLSLKHIVPGSWMNDKERSLSLYVRLDSQIQRRWFEMGNDMVWTAVSALSLFLLLGTWTPAMVYVSTAAFAFDALNAIARAGIEWERLYGLQRDYSKMLETVTDKEQKQLIQHHLHFIEKRLSFEQERLKLNIMNMVTVFVGMSLVLPFVAAPPALLFVSALCLLALWGAMYVLTSQVETKRPQERLGFFAKTKSQPDNTSSLNDNYADENSYVDDSRYEKSSINPSYGIS